MTEGSNTRHGSAQSGDTRPPEAGEPATDLARWNDPDELRPNWARRAGLAARHIPQAATVLDIGCGKMDLERALPPNCRYLPADIVRRDARTILCDLNKAHYPEAAAREASVITMLGVVEYVVEPKPLFAWLGSRQRILILSYHPTDGTGHMDRTAHGWLNHLSLQEWGELVRSAGLTISATTAVTKAQTIFVLRPAHDKTRTAASRHPETTRHS